jgi:hypothetical protein
MDECFPIAGGEAAVHEASGAFAALGSPEALVSHKAVHWHGWVNGNREALYGFMLSAFNQTSTLGSR